jgi:hypothetical protein
MAATKRRECHCRICEQAPGDRAWDEGDRKLVADVQRHGWGVIGIQAEEWRPGWAFTVGLWHTFGVPELAMFGLQVRDMQTWLNEIGEQVRNGQAPMPNELREEILEGFPVTFRGAESSWYQRLFGWAIWFYRKPPLPVVEVIWPDTQGRFPWQAEAGLRCRHHQPRLWTPFAEQPIGVWRTGHGKDDMEWPFNEPIDGRAFTTNRITAGQTEVLAVYHDSDGDWQFIDGGPTEREDIEFVHLGHFVKQHPYVVELADMKRGWRAVRQAPSRPWIREPNKADG